MNKDTLYQNLDQYHLLNQGHLSHQDSGKSAADWAAYAAAAGAALAMSSAADATVIYSGTQNIQISITEPAANTNGVQATQSAQTNIDLNNDGTPDFFGALFWNDYFLSTTSSGTPLTYNQRGGNAQFNPLPGGNAAVMINASSELMRLALNQSIGPAATNFNTNAGVARDLRVLRSNTGVTSSEGTWPVSAPGFAGVRLTVGVNTFYGWIRLSWNDTISTDGMLGADGYPDQLTIIDWAFENTPGTAILAGATSSPPVGVPEPGSLALLATGAAGIAALRRRRRQTH